MADKLLRSWHLLRAIPRHPRRKTPSELRESLRLSGYELTLRSVQRDLIALSTPWGITCETEGVTSYWYWSPDAKLFDIPNLGSAEALVFLMAKAYLQDAIPRSQLTLLAPYFERAEQLIGSAKIPISRWHQRVRVIQRGPSLHVPVVRPEVVKEVHEALLYERRVRLTYKKRGEKSVKDYELSPQALILREGVMYLVASANEYEELLHFALHRASGAALIERPAKRIQGFNLDHYVDNERAFSYPTKKQVSIRLRASLDQGLADHLSERPLSGDQSINQKEGSEYVLTATVVDTAELRWWLLGLGPAIVVSAPSELRQWMKQTIESMSKMY